MKKWMKIILALIATLFVGGYFLGVPKLANTMVDMSLNYDIRTHESVLESEEVRNIDYDIYDNKDPEDYGYEEWREIKFTSLYDKDVELGGWWIPSAKSDSAGVIMINHGRTANRLKPMKYLELFKELGLDTVYNFFIPDLRNSGTSSPAQTELGNKFAEDIAAATFMLQDSFKTKDFTYFSFSMGALATCIFMDRPDLVEKWTIRGINIQQLILDSPMSNASAIMTHTAERMNLPNFIMERVMTALNDSITTPDGKPYLDEMAMSNLLKNVKIPILVLNNRGDISTPQVILEKELEAMKDMKNITTKFFDATPGEEPQHLHVQMYPQYKEIYTETIRDFLQ